MKVLKKALASCLFFCFPLIANAAIISYEGSIGSDENPFGTVTGMVGGSAWYDNDAANTDFWSFDIGSGGLWVDIWAVRTDSDLDSAFTLYSGTTTADETEFDSWDSFDDLTWIDEGDDEIPSSSGPYADPALYNLFLAEGSYTLAIGGYGSNGDGPYEYELSIGQPGDAPVVPIPATIWLLGFGLAGMFGHFKKIKQARDPN